MIALKQNRVLLQQRAVITPFVWIIGIVLLWVIIPAKINSQNKHEFTRITIDHGLSQNSVNCILEDAEGFLWFGTNDGLNKYDGYSLSIYRSNFQDSTTISHNWIQSFFRDQDNVLWIGTRSGINKFVRETNSFEKFIDVSDRRNFIASNDILSIQDDPSNNAILWLGTPRGLKKFNKKNKTFTIYKPCNDSNNTAINKNKINSLCRDIFKRLWVGTGSGLYQFDLTTEKFKKIDSKTIQALYADGSGNVWVGTESFGLLRLDPNGVVQKFEHDKTNNNSLAHNNVLSIVEDHTGSLWIGTNGGGLDKFEIGSGHFTHHLANPNVLNSLSNNEVRVIYADKSRNLWFGTWGGGINKLSYNREKFGLYTNELDHQNILRGNIFSIHEDRSGNLWLGTGNNGLYSIDMQTNSITVYSNNARTANKIGGNFVILIYEDKEGTLWIGTTSGGLDKFDRGVQSFRNYRHDPDDPSSLGYNNIQTVLEDKDGRFWVGTFGGGLDELDKQSNTFIHYRHDESNDHSISSDIVQHLIEDREGNLWIATAAGLNQFDKTSKRFMIYSNNLKWVNNSSIDYVYCIYEDPYSERLWLGTAGGLVLFDKITKAFRCFDEKSGLSNNTVYGILGDNRNDLWLSTNKGLSRFNIATESFRNYDKDDGLQSNEFNQGAFFKSPKGQMFFGGVHGLNVFHPDSIRDNFFKPPVVITAFKVFNQELPAPLALDELHLDYRDYAFSFEFASLDFTNPSKNKYAYRLDGFDVDWNYTNADRRFATYTNLDPGNYIFHVKGSNNDGVWNNEGQSIKIFIAPPFWRTWWFIALSIVIIISGAYTTVANRVKRMLELERMRTKIAADLHDNIGTGLTEISILSEVGLQQAGTSIENTREKFKKIGDTSRLLGQNMSDIVWLINPRYDSLGDILIQLKKSYEDIFRSSNITFRSPSIKDWDELHPSIVNRHHVYLFLKEAINNSLKHSRCRIISLDLVRSAHGIEIHYSDDGIGFNPEKVPEGNGLDNMAHRAKLMSGKMNLISSNENGTKIILYLPHNNKTKKRWMERHITTLKFLISALKI